MAMVQLRDVTRRLRRGGARQDVSAGLVLGLESIPDGLASGVLAGVNPLLGLYTYLLAPWRGR